MAQCLACKRKDSVDRCLNKSLTNFMYCGRHIKIKDVKPWIAWRPVLLHHIVRIQAIWRGYLTRKPLRLAGVGVLKRSICINDDEIITMESKERIHPYDFFSLEEDGKVWFFDQKTIFQWAQKDLVIRNPYTRKQLSNVDTCRIRKLYVWRRRQKMDVFHDAPIETTTHEKRDKRWMRVVQIMREAGHQIHPEHFISFNYPQMAAFINSFVEDLRWWTNEKPGRPIKYFRWMLNIRNMMHTYHSNVDLSSDLACILLTILLDVPNIQHICSHIYTGYSVASLSIGIRWFINPELYS